MEERKVVKVRKHCKISDVKVLEKVILYNPKNSIYLFTFGKERKRKMEKLFVYTFTHVLTLCVFS